MRQSITPGNSYTKTVHNARIEQNIIQRYSRLDCVGILLYSFVRGDVGRLNNFELKGKSRRA